MKAFVYELKGTKDVLPGFVVGPYSTLQNLIRYGLKHFPKGRYRIKAYHNWDRRYSKEDINIVIVKT